MIRRDAVADIDKVQGTETRLQISARIFRMAWATVRQCVPDRFLKDRGSGWRPHMTLGRVGTLIPPQALIPQASLLQSSPVLSTSCSGVFTVECAAAILQETVNHQAGNNGLPADSPKFTLDIKCERCFES